MAVVGCAEQTHENPASSQLSPVGVLDHYRNEGTVFYPTAFCLKDDRAPIKLHITIKPVRMPTQHHNAIPMLAGFQDQGDCLKPNQEP